MKLLKVAVNITYGTIDDPRGQKHRKISFPILWELLYQYDVSHDEVGGVTDGRFRLEVQSKNRLSVKRLPSTRVSAVLGKALRNTKYDGGATAEPHNREFSV